MAHFSRSSSPTRRYFGPLLPKIRFTSFRPPNRTNSAASDAIIVAKAKNVTREKPNPRCLSSMWSSMIFSLASESVSVVSLDPCFGAPVIESGLPVGLFAGTAFSLLKSCRQFSLAPWLYTRKTGLRAQHGEVPRSLQNFLRVQRVTSKIVLSKRTKTKSKDFTHFARIDDCNIFNRTITVSLRNILCDRSQPLLNLWYRSTNLSCTQYPYPQELLRIRPGMMWVSKSNILA